MAENYKLLMHGWGNTPAQKRKEAEYNKKYYQEHKEKWQKTQSAYEKLASDTEKLTGKQDENTYSANTKLHIRRTPKKTVDETSYVNDYVDRNKDEIYKELVDDWLSKNAVKYEDRNEQTIADFNSRYRQFKIAAERNAVDVAKKRAKDAYSKIYNESEDRVQARKLRTQEINDAKAANEASKAESARQERNKKLAQRDKDLVRYTQEAKKAKAQVAKKENLRWQAELAAEKNAPLHKKARKFVDGTVEVAMDNAKNALSKLKKPAETARAKQDKKKKISQGKAWVFKNLGIELF